MDQRLLLALAYAVPGLAIALLGLFTGYRLSARYAELRVKAAEAERPVPPLVTMYFKGSARVLVLTGVLFVGMASGDVITAYTAPGEVLARVLGYGSALALLICGFALLMQGTADRQLQLQAKKWRVAQIVSGIAGIAVSAYGMGLVTWYGGTWGGLILHKDFVKAGVSHGSIE